MKAGREEEQKAGTKLEEEEPLFEDYYPNADDKRHMDPRRGRPLETNLKLKGE